MLSVCLPIQNIFVPYIPHIRWLAGFLILGDGDTYAHVSAEPDLIGTSGLSEATYLLAKQRAKNF